MSLTTNSAFLGCQTGTGLVRFIGLSGMAGAFQTHPAIADAHRPKLTSVAALGLVLVMLLAAGFHILQGGAQFVPVNLLLGGIAGFIAWGRLRGHRSQVARGQPLLAAK